MRGKNNSGGIRIRHRQHCRSREDGACNCEPAYEAWVFSKRDGRKIRKTFSRESEAKLWRADSAVQLNRGTMRAPKPTTLREAWDAWKAGAEAGTIRNRSGDRYKPGAIRGYDQGMRLRVLDDLGSVRLSDLQRSDLQDLIERLLAEGLSPSTVQVTILPLRAICKRALKRGDLGVNPCEGLDLPAIERDAERRFADPTEAAKLIAAAPDEDRAFWATAFYAGLRRGEMQALRCEDVDLATGLIHVKRGWDSTAGEIKPKSRVGRRKVPIVPALRDHLIEHRVATGRTEGLVFGETADTPFRPNAIQRRADAAWKAAKLTRITPHGGRHTFASLMIGAGVNAKAISTFMGHANISITLDLYGHLMPGSEAEAADLMHEYLTSQHERAEDAARAAEPVAAAS
jgi:integrase